VSSTSDRLLVRLREFGLDLPEGTRLIRLRPGPADRSIGAWSWCALGPTARELGIGSQHPMTEILKAANLSTVKDMSGDITVYPLQTIPRAQVAV
jgi:hypothetical protein